MNLRNKDKSFYEGLIAGLQESKEMFRVVQLQKHKKPADASKEFNSLVDNAIDLTQKMVKIAPARKIKHLIVTPYRQSFIEICRLWGFNHNDQSQFIWVNCPHRLFGIGGDGYKLLVHSDWLGFENFERWQAEIKFIAAHKNIPVEWDAERIP